MGLMSTLAMSTALAASLNSSLTPLEAPDLVGQSPQVVQSVQGDTVSASGLGSTTKGKTQRFVPLSGKTKDGRVAPPVVNGVQGDNAIQDHQSNHSEEKVMTQEDIDQQIQASSDFLLGNHARHRVDSTTLTGVDISSHQHTEPKNVDAHKVATEGNKKFAFIKATEGINYVNPFFRQDTIDFIDTNTPVGFYHYAQPTADTEDARRQARLYVSVTGISQGVKSLPPVLDIEENKDNLTPDQLQEWVAAYVDEIKILTGKNTMIYTYPVFWKEKMGNTTRFSDLPLWIASYNNLDHPGQLPGGWSNWTFWQYTSKGNVEGLDGDIDINYYNGDEASLRSLYF